MYQRQVKENCARCGDFWIPDEIAFVKTYVNGENEIFGLCPRCFEKFKAFMDEITDEVEKE